MPTNLKSRTLTGAALALAGFVLVWFAPAWLFSAALAALAAGVMLEWKNLRTKADKPLPWLLLGLVYVALPLVSLLAIRELAGREAVLWLIAVVAATDIGAYFAGSLFGKHLWVPKISPKKTWEGLGGGMICAAIAAWGLATLLAVPMPHAALMGAILALVGQGGDLFESWLKRRAGVKDSGTLLPGHGGLLDRFDALVPASAVTLLALLLL